MKRNTTNTVRTVNALPFKISEFKERTQIYNPRIGKWVKRDSKTGLFTSVKVDGKPFARVKVEESPFDRLSKDCPPAA